MFYKKPKGTYGKKFEAGVLSDLDTREKEYTFEGVKIPYTISAVYYPDIVLPNGVIVEVKSYLQPEDEQKMKAVKACNPTLDIRFLFEKPNKPMPGRKMTHGEWATKYGFPWCGGTIPEEWTR